MQAATVKERHGVVSSVVNLGARIGEIENRNDQSY